MDSQNELVEAVKNTAIERDDGRLVLRCADAFELAERFGAELGDIAPICNQNKIKIVQCQLGCF